MLGAKFVELLIKYKKAGYDLYDAHLRLWDHEIKEEMKKRRKQDDK